MSRPSTSLSQHDFLDVDARDKRGHDESGVLEFGITPLRFDCMRLAAAALDRYRRLVAGDEMSREIETALGEL